MDHRLEIIPNVQSWVSFFHALIKRACGFDHLSYVGDVNLNFKLPFLILFYFYCVIMTFRIFVIHCEDFPFEKFSFLFKVFHFEFIQYFVRLFLLVFCKWFYCNSSFIDDSLLLRLKCSFLNLIFKCNDWVVRFVWPLFKLSSD